MWSKTDRSSTAGRYTEAGKFYCGSPPVSKGVTRTLSITPFLARGLLHWNLKLMQIKETLLKQYDRCYNENGWFVAVRNAINGITAEQAAWKPEGSDNS